MGRLSTSRTPDFLDRATGLRDDDSATDGLVYQQVGVGGRYGVPINPAAELKLDKILVALGLLAVLGHDLLLLAKPSGDGVVLTETLDDESLHILNQVAVETLEPDYVEVVVPPSECSASCRQESRRGCSPHR